MKGEDEDLTSGGVSCGLGGLWIIVLIPATVVAPLVDAVVSWIGRH